MTRRAAEFRAIVPMPATSTSHAPGAIAASVRDLTKVYQLGVNEVHALRGVSFEVPEGDYVSVMGPSGSGKSTLLNLLGCLDQPTTGEFYLGGENVATMTDDQLADVRSTRLGMVFQSFNLLPALTVVENIELPLYYSGKLGRESHQLCQSLAERVGLRDRMDHRPNQLSGGQQQRVAIARSLANDPRFILADEPTGNLDSSTTEEILQLLASLNGEGRTLILVTHEDEVAARTKRTLRLRDGKLVSDQRLDSLGDHAATTGDASTHASSGGQSP